MSGRLRYRDAITHTERRTEKVKNFIPGILGFTIKGKNVVEVDPRPGYVYVRIRDNFSEVVMAYNSVVAPVYGLPVLLVRDDKDKNKYKVYGRDTARYANWGTSPYLPKHGSTHSFDPKAPGFDPVWVWGRQMMPLAATPSGSLGAPNVIIQEGTYWQTNAWHFAGATGTADITTYNPTGSTSRMVLVYLDANGNPQLEPGTTFFTSTLTGTSQVFPYLPAIPNTYAIPIAGIRLESGTSTIQWNNIYDLRPWIVGSGYMPTGTVTGATGPQGPPGPQGIPGPVTTGITGTSSFEFNWYIDGAIATGTNVAAEYISPRNQTIEKVIFSIKDKGTAGSSIIDLQLNGLTIFGTRPTINYDDPDDVDIVTPTTTDISQNDVLLLNIDSVAAGAESASIGIIFTGWVSTTGSGGHVIQDDGVSQSQRLNLNFVGAGFSVYDNVAGNATIVSGTAALPLFSPYIIPFADSLGELKENTLLNAEEYSTYPVVNIGAVRGFFTNSSWYNLNSVVDDSVGQYAQGLWGFGYQPRQHFLYANGTYGAPTAIEVNDVLGEIYFYGYNGSVMKIGGIIQGAAESGWAASTGSASLQFYIVDESAPDNVTNPLSIYDHRVQVSTGTTFNFGNGNADGSWRISMSGNNLVFQRRETGTWNTKQTISA